MKNVVQTAIRIWFMFSVLIIIIYPVTLIPNSQCGKRFLEPGILTDTNMLVGGGVKYEEG